MANWNLSVDLRAQASDLVRGLRQAATAARALDRETTTTRSRLGSLSAEATRAGRQIRTLGQEAQRAGRLQQQAGQQAQRAGREMRTLASESQRAGREQRQAGQQARAAAQNLRALGRESSQAARSQRTAAQAAQQASRQFQALARDMRGAVTQMRALARQSTTTATHVRNVGSHGEQSMGRFAGAVGRAKNQMAGLAGLLGGGGLVLGLGALVKQGNEYQREMNMFGAVTSANATQMAQAGAVAKQLGEDLSLPSVTAADAAAAMVDMAKAGFNASQAVAGTRAALQLAAGQHIKAADAAKYLGDTMDNFALSAGDAGQAADTLSSTAVSASGGIKDIWTAMSYTGPVAHALGVNLQDTAAAVAGLGKAGIIGSKAGTTLRGALTNLAKPTAQMKAGLKTLGIEAFDSTGTFKGLAYVIDGLHTAQGKLSQKDFVGAVGKAFGKPAMAGMIALGHAGVEEYDNLRGAVSEAGKAAQLAGAQSKGLVGAMTQLKTQGKQTSLVLYNAMAPGLEKVTRLMTSGLAKATPHLEAAINYVTNLGQLFGPSLVAKFKGGLGTLAAQAKSLAAPLKSMGANIAADGLHLLMTAASTAWDVLQKLIAAVQPIGAAFQDLTANSDHGANALDILTTALDDLMAVIRVVANVLQPIGTAIGGVVRLFGALPGPVQAAVAAMLLMRRVTPHFNTLASTVQGRVGGAFRGFADQMRMQQGLAAASGASLGRFGAAFATLQARSRVLGGMSESFRNTSGAIQAAGGRMAGFRSTLGGVATAMGTGARMGLRGAMSGLAGAFGGPWGLALAGAGIALGLLAQQQQKAAQAAREHQARISGLTQALITSKGIIDADVRAAAIQQLQDKKVGDGKQSLVDVMRKAGVASGELVDAYTGQGAGAAGLQKKLEGLVNSHGFTYLNAANGRKETTLFGVGVDAKAALDALGPLNGEFDAATQAYKDYLAGVSGAKSNTTSLDKIKVAITGIGDASSDSDTRVRYLREGLDLLSGGSLDVEAASARLQEQIRSINEGLDGSSEKAAGWGAALVNSSGKIDTTKVNGQKLFSTLQDLGTATADVAVKTWEYSRAQGKGIPESLKAAQDSMQPTMTELQSLAQEYHLTGEQVIALADHYGLLPSKVSTLIAAQDKDGKGLNEMLAQLLDVQGELGRLPKATKIQVDVLSPEAQKKLKDLGFEIKTLPGSKKMEITAITDEAKARLAGLIATESGVDDKTVTMTVEQRGALLDLQTLQGKIGKTKGKPIVMQALTKSAEEALKNLGFKVTHMKDGSVSITIPTGGAKHARDVIQNYVDSVHGKDVPIHVRYYITTTGSAPSLPSNVGGGKGNPFNRADGGIDRYAGAGRMVAAFAGGTEDHRAQIAGPGAMRLWAEPETGGEAYIPLSGAKRGRSTAILSQVARQFGYRLEKFARGGLMRFAGGGSLGGFTYTPTEPSSTFGAGAGMDRYDAAIQRLKDAWDKLNSALSTATTKTKAVKDAQAKQAQTAKDGARSVSAAEKNLASVRKGKHTHKQLAAAEKRLSDARYNAAKNNKSAAKRTNDAKAASTTANKDVSAARKSRDAADTALGLKKGTKAPSGFNLAGYQKQLAAAAAANAAWERNLATIGKRAGSDVAETLRGMGEDGQALVAALAKAGSKQFADIVKNLKSLAPSAKASLADFTSQLKSATGSSKAFQDNLLKLASMGYGDLATQLAAQGDAAAATIAAAAVKDSKSAAAANVAAKAGSSLLSGEDVSASVTVLSALRGAKGMDFAGLVRSTGLDVSTLLTLLPKIRAQIDALPSDNKMALLAQWTQLGLPAPTKSTPTPSLPGLSITPRPAVRTGGPHITPRPAVRTGRQLTAADAVRTGPSIQAAAASTTPATPQVIVVQVPAQAQTIDNSKTVVLNGADQNLATQRADLLRHMALVG